MSLYTDADRGREQPVLSETPYRSPFRRDYARLLHSPAFRRLQGKTQLFPGVESDFFRNRLTHSLEVAQIAKSIALRLNHSNDYFTQYPIDLDLVETAALAHDLGHPPFGHNGERALDDCMKEKGGFEGNAQTLRILARLEKKIFISPDRVQPSSTHEDNRAGLNLTYRTLAATIKYDKCIPLKREHDDALVKGYYRSEEKLVNRIKRSVLGPNMNCRQLKTIECQIMDLADDIAYSTYDLEDALKAGFVTPIGMISAASDNKLAQILMQKTKLNEDEILKHIMDIWLEHISDLKSFGIEPDDLNIGSREDLAFLVTLIDRASQNLNYEGAIRTNFTSELVGEYVEGVDVVEINAEAPVLSTITLKGDLLRRVELLKHLTYELVIKSPRLKTVEYRGSDIVTEIFCALSERGGELLLPDDYRDLIANLPGSERDRAICDFIAGMTDRYAVEFYGRLKSENAQTIFKPL